MLQTLPRLRRTGSTSPGLRLVARLAIAAGAGACAFALFSWSAHAADWQRDGALTRTADGYDQTVTFTGPGGNARTVSRDIDIEWPASP